MKLIILKSFSENLSQQYKKNDFDYFRLEQ